jgi:ATP-binding cassette, subfamily B, bacterial
LEVWITIRIDPYLTVGKKEVDVGMHNGSWRAYIHSEEEKPKVTRQLLGRVLSYAMPYQSRIIVMLLLILCSTGLALLTPLVVRDLIDYTIPHKNITRLIWLALALLLIPSLGGVINIFQRRLNAAIGEGVIYDLRVALFSRLQSMSLRFFTNTKVGELISRINNDVVGAQNAISNTIVSMITNIIQTAAVLAVMFSLEWHLTVISIIILPLFLVVARKMGNRLRDIARTGMEANAKMNAMLNETLNIGGALLVKLFGRAKQETDRFDQRAQAVRDIGVQRAVVGMSFIMIIGLLGAIGSAFVYGVGGYLVIKDVFTVGTIVAFGSYLGSLYSALQGLANAPVEFATSIVSFERVFEIIDLPLEITEKPQPIVLQNSRGEIEFVDVSFRYGGQASHDLRDVKRYGQMDNVTAVFSDISKEPAGLTEPESARDNEWILEHIRFHAHPGELVALVGPSGAGKTTMTYLIPRLYDPSEGIVKIDGRDIRDYKLDSLIQQIGVVTQESYLFHDTVRTNLLFAKPDASDEELYTAMRAANIESFIRHLPDQLDTIVGERGYRLSGGEKQRIALARVILKNPRILILDEATSNLDSESEALIQQALDEIMKGRTSIVIAHRLSTILAANQILVIDQGKIVEQGTHETLLGKNGLYASLYHTQFKPG